MAQILLVTPASQLAAPIPPELALLPHEVTAVQGADAVLAHPSGAELAIVDCRSDPGAARATVQLLATGSSYPLLLLVPVVSLPLVSADWNAADFIVADASAAEWEARIRLILAALPDAGEFTSGPIAINESAYAVTLDGRPLDLTYTEFELLSYLVQHPNRVLSREQLLSDVWGYDYYGGIRTVDVHIRRLRAKLGAEADCIVTVRNVGYRYSPDRFAETE